MRAPLLNDPIENSSETAASEELESDEIVSAVLSLYKSSLQNHSRIYDEKVLSPQHQTHLQRIATLHHHNMVLHVAQVKKKSASCTTGRTAVLLSCPSDMRLRLLSGMDNPETQRIQHVF